MGIALNEPFMKNSTSAYFLLFMSFSFMAACNKNSASTGGGTNSGLTLSKTTVKIGEPLIATTKSSSSAVTWSTPSNGQVWPSANTDSATFLFTHAGSYQITAYIPNSNTGMGPITEDSSSSTVVVTDSVYGDTSGVHCDVVLVKNLSTDDQINLTPLSCSDTALAFLAHTQDLYTGSPILDCGGTIPMSNNIFECDFNSAFDFACIGSATPAPASGVVFFTKLTNGTHDLVFKLNGTTYQGSINATNTNCSITWNYTSGVTISPLTIQKQ
jgi:hypothetical protein